MKRAWTLYRGFDSRPSNATYHWWQISQSLSLMRMLLIDFLVLMVIFHIPQAIITMRNRKKGDKEQL